LESDISKNRKEIDILKLTNQNLLSSNQLLSHEIKMLQTKTSSEYCQLISENICGPCTCLDDYQLKQKYYCNCQNLTPKRDCLEFYQAGIKTNGIYKITMNNFKTVQVYCDQTTDGGGWTVIQRRVDGSRNFYQDWITYKQGFGYLQNEFYVGNEILYILSLQALYPKGSELRIDMEAWNGRGAFAKYSSFQIGNEATKYKIHVSGYSGNSGDSLTYHNGCGFSTYDQDNDNAAWGFCAHILRGGWWFKHCHASNLNGEYLIYNQTQPAKHRGVEWTSWKNSHSLKFVEMKMRRKI